MARTRSQSTTRKSTSSARKPNRSRSTSKSSSGLASTLEGWYASPAFSYVVGGIGFAALAGAAYKFSDRYPRITSFFQENLDVIESKLAEFRGNDVASSSVDEATH